MSLEDSYPDEDLSAADLDHLTSLLSSVTDADSMLTAPPSAVWEAISDELQSGEDAEIIPIRPRRVPQLLAAAAALVVGALGLAGLLRSEPDQVVVAKAAILNDNLPVADDAWGSASLISDDGVLWLQIDVEELAAESGYMELWIINGDVTDMRSLGELSGDGLFRMPDDVDPAEFPIVDISFEERDGVATHSGNSVLRGVLDI